ncbi:MAG: ATP-dependent RecD-like DNA helicase [Chlamydiota bacterium]
MEQIFGYVENILFTNPENGFTVAKLKEKQKKDLTLITGSLPSIQPGETLLCEGEWKNHPQHGKQFLVQSFTTKAPQDLIGIQKYLESGLIKGIGPIYAKKIVDQFGLETLVILEQTPNKLLDIPGIGEKRITQIKECWIAQKAIREVMIFLRTYGVSPSHAQKIFKKHGDNSIKKVQENPYQLAKEIRGIGFKSADLIATKLGYEKTSPLRIESGIEHVLWEYTNSGHTCHPKASFFQDATKILEVEESLVQPILEQMIQKGTIIESTIQKEPFIWLKMLYHVEINAAKELFRILKSPTSLRSIDTKKALEWVQSQLKIQLAKEQSEAVAGGLTQKMQIITGGPGTGKTTITKAILEISEKITKKILLAAPTGRAAKRLTQITGKKAFTIHALLEFDFSSNGFKKNRENPLRCDLLIIDEASMIDSFLLFHLLRAIDDHTRVLFVGDVDQLPSVGPGNVLKDLISSRLLPVIRLTEIFRQAANSKIIVNAHKINQGEFPELISSAWSDFQFFPCNEPEEILKKILSLLQNDLPEKKRFHPIEDIQVLSPMKKGIIGTENLNLILQNALNPSSHPFYRGGSRFHIHDKVMQIRNNYNKNVYNGDLGKIVAIDMETQIMTIAFDEKEVAYDFMELDEITLAYAVSVHKYQGSECPCIIVPIHMCHFKLLFRNLLYTAVTRGKKMVILVGTKQAVAIAIKNTDALHRYTGLECAITEMLSRKENK